MTNFTPGGDINPNSSVNVRPGFSPGESGGAPAKPAAAQSTGPTTSATRHGVSGIDSAMSAHADKMHPVKRRGR